MDVSVISATLISSDVEEYDTMLSLLRLAYIVVFMKTLLTEEDTEESNFLVIFYLKSHLTKMRFFVLKIIPIRQISDTQIRLSDDCSGLMLFSSQRICHTLHEIEVSSACGYELYF